MIKREINTNVLFNVEEKESVIKKGTNEHEK